LIDLRSDTVTKPGKGMLEAMFNAELGDDVYGEDPTINSLQQKCCELTGKEAALFTPTGVMANQLAIKSHTNPGDEIILEYESHIFNYETAAPSVLSNVQIVPVEGEKGILKLDNIKRYIRPKEYYFPLSKLICLENTHNRAGGIIQPLENIKEISEFAKNNGIKMHLDGARLFNASVETNISVKEYSGYFDTVYLCFSKGLGCPVGSVLCGDTETIKIAHKWRKIIGGGMRQAGILASAAIYALDNNVKRLKKDNENARTFGEKLSKSDHIEIEQNDIHSNIVVFKSKKYGKNDLINKFKECGILVSSGSYDFIRAVFHMDVYMEDLNSIMNSLAIL
jgi:threonine aldolase